MIRWVMRLGGVWLLGSVGGCLASLQGNLDLLLGYGAIDNALRLPYSAVASLARFLLRAG